MVTWGHGVGQEVSDAVIRSMGITFGFAENLVMICFLDRGHDWPVGTLHQGEIDDKAWRV